MKTECTTEQLLFQDLDNKQVLVTNDAEQISSDGGLLFLRQIEKKHRIIHRLAEHFNDYRNDMYVVHSLERLLRQRIYGIVQGYEDLNDHDQWRNDPLLAAALERVPGGRGGAGKSTLNRLEGTPEICASKDRYKKISWHEQGIRDALVEVGLDTFKKPPKVIVLDFDTTDEVLYGTQEGRFFSGYYDDYCYQPLYVFAGDLLLCAEMLTGENDITPYVLRTLQFVAKKIRSRWPRTKVIIRGDSGFCREPLMAFCEENPGFYYVFGLPKNRRLIRAIGGSLARVKKSYQQDGFIHREYRELRYRTRKSWSCTRRVVAKAEHLAKGSNPRFVVANIDPAWWPAQKLYEKLYCARGNMENRIKEQKLDLFSDRASTHRLRTNQLRLWFSSFAYLFAVVLKRHGLAGTELATAYHSTIRLKLLKVAAMVRVSVRRVVIRLPRSFPYWDYWKLLQRRLSAV
jgi:hypothetical protein